MIVKVGDRVTYKLQSGSILGPDRVADVEAVDGEPWLVLDKRVTAQVGAPANLTLVKIPQSMVVEVSV